MSESEQAGRVVGGRFELLDRLGRGGMGTVWRARDVSLQRLVAIKEVRSADTALFEHDPALAAAQRERVLRESRALARVQHPNVVSIYQIIESDDAPYPWIVMELVDGTSLDSRLRNGVLAPAEAARVGRDILRALRAAHAAGVLHRDVKPGNVLLRRDGSAVLTDFGIAALHDSGQLTATGEVIGSPEYIAPERLLGDETKTASDFWSLAMLLYVAVEGHHPLRRASTMATLAAVMTEQVPPPRRAGALGAALSAVLVADPADRPTGEVLDRMLAAAEHETVAQRGPRTPAVPVVPLGPPRYEQPYQVYQQHGPTPSPKTVAPRGRTGAVVFALAAAALVLTVALLLVRDLGSSENPSSAGTDTPVTQATTLPKTDVSPNPTTTAASEDLHTPAGARSLVSALSEVMGGTKVSELVIHSGHASAIAPAAAVKNGFDNFEYRDGVATRKGPDTVDADRAVLDLNTVNWDALPELWKRADKELGIAEPTMRYIVVDTGLIDGNPALKLYLSDDYGGAYLLADLDGDVIELFARDG